MNFAIYQVIEERHIHAAVTSENKVTCKAELTGNHGPVKILHFEEIEDYLGHKTADLCEVLMAVDEFAHGSIGALLAGLIDHVYKLPRPCTQRRKKKK